MFRYLRASLGLAATAFAFSPAAVAAAPGPAGHWRVEDTGVVILNDNPNTQRLIVGIDSFDIDGDGIVDSILVGPELGPITGPLTLSDFKRQSIHILRGGAVTTNGATLFPGGRPSYVASGWPLSYDFNGDGKRDIYIADLGPDAPPSPGIQNVVWLSGNGSFTPAAMQPSFSAVHGASTGRLAGEPVIFANALCCGAEQTPFLYVLRNNVFVIERSRLPALVTGRLWTGSAIADIDGDGIDDLALGDFSAVHPNHPLIGSYAIFGTSAGWLTGPAVRLPHPMGAPISTLTALSVKVADIDGDGKKDLVIGYTAYYNTRGIQILRNNGNRTFTDISASVLGADTYLPGSPPGNLSVVDLNGDGCVDLVEPESSSAGGPFEHGRIFLNDCQGRLIKANGALASVLGEFGGGHHLFPFTDYTGRTSFYVPMAEPPSATSNGLSGTRYKKITNLRNLPTPVNGAIVFSDVFAENVSAVIAGYYQTILGRAPDAAGASFWAAEANRVAGLGADVREVFFAMSVQFFNSAEYLGRGTNDTQYLTDLYRTFFTRAPDPGGLAFWQSQLSAGMDRGAMLNNFLFSTEFSNKMGGLFDTANTRPEVNLTIDLYRGILGVLPDSGGFNYWLGRIRQAQCQGPAAVSAEVSNLSGLFVASAEYQQRESARPGAERTNRHVGDLYNAFLRRGGDLAGYTHWVDQIKSGASSRDQVRQSFLQSAEFQARVLSVVAAGCNS